MPHRLLPLLLVGCLALVATAPAAAQSSNLDTVEGPNPEAKTTLTITPHILTEEVSARALGIERPNSTRWALTLIGISRSDSVSLTLGDKTLPIEDVSRPAEDEVGPTRLFLTQETFLAIAETDGVTLHVGDATTEFPEKMRAEMQKIYERVL